MKIKYSFEVARRITRKHGFHSPEEFLEYDCPGAYGVCKDVEQIYKEQWRGWDDFLGIPPSFEEGRTCVRAHGILSMEDYFEFVKMCEIEKEDNLSSRLPCRPDLYYKSEWRSWNDWLGLK